MILTKHIYLTGFMGVGKTHLGRLLAKDLNVPFVDTDTQIEQTQKQSIAMIFKSQGETAFRDYESQTLESLAKTQPSVISLGGGVILRETNRALLNQGYWIFLHQSLDLIETRLRFTEKRPLLKADSWRALYSEREPIYQLAHHTVFCGSDSDEAVLQKIKRLLT